MPEYVKDLDMNSYFSFEDMTCSAVAKKMGIENKPDTDEMLNVSRVIMTLNKMRETYFDRAIRINSGFRSPELNRAVGGAARSKHMSGTAADIQPWLLPPGEEGCKMMNELANAAIAMNYDDDFTISKVIMERSGEKRWIHVEIPLKGGRMNRRNEVPEMVLMVDGVTVDSIKGNLPGWSTKYNDIKKTWLK